MWEDLAEVRSVAVDKGYGGRGIGHHIVTRLLETARELGVRRVFCLTFEVEFFARHGFQQILGTPVAPEVYEELSALTTKAWQSSWTSIGSSRIRWATPDVASPGGLSQMSDSPTADGVTKRRRGRVPTARRPVPRFPVAAASAAAAGTQQWQEPQQDWGRSYEPSYDQYGGSQGDEIQLAPIARRAGARIIDNALVAVFGFALVLPVTVAAFGLGDSGDEDEGGIWNWPIIFTLFCVMSVLPFLYEAVQLSMWGRTLGKRVLGLGIVQARPVGRPMTTTQAVWR